MYQRRRPALCQGMNTYGDAAAALVSPRGGDTGGDTVAMPAQLCLRLLRGAARIHRAGLKSYGLLVAEPGTAGYPFTAAGVVFLDPRKNRRNDPGHRAAFRAQGEYFRQYEDAGFVADPAELLAAWRAIEDCGRQVVAPFHSHRRQPANPGRPGRAAGHPPADQHPGPGRPADDRPGRVTFPPVSRPAPHRRPAVHPYPGRARSGHSHDLCAIGGMSG